MKIINHLYTVISIGYLCIYSNALPAFNPILLWREGINWIQMIAGISIPVSLKEETVIIGSAVKAYYLLPTNLSQLSPSRSRARSNREIPTYNIYTHIENIHNRSLSSMPYRDGNREVKSCFLKIICEYSTNPMKNHSLMSQVIDVLLRPSKISDEIIANEYSDAETKGKAKLDCSSLFPDCQTNFFDGFGMNALTY